MIIDSVDTDAQVLVIAEIGNNHEGDAGLAKELVVAAAESGADAVKVQIIAPDRLVNIADSRRIEQLQGFRLPMVTFEELAGLAKSKGVLFMASVFDVDSLDESVGFLDAIKIASSDLNFIQLLAAAASKGKPIVLSTGLGTFREVESAVATISKHLPAGRTVADSLAVLHCITAYPTPIEQANLNAITTFSEAFDATVGYSDHTLGIEAAIIAASLGARVIEKHFTLDKNHSSFRDHQLSADPEDLKKLTSVIHAFDDILGSGEKRPMACEVENLVGVRRSIVTAHDLPAGTILSLEDLDFVRPASGLEPADAPSVIGRRLRVSLKHHELLRLEHLDAE